MARPAVVLTRPEPEAGVWAQTLQHAGWPVVRLPLLHLSAPSQAEHCAALQTVWRDLSGWDALMFVSAAAVRYFFAACPPDWHRPAALPRSWTPGLGTAEAVRRAWTDLGVDHPVVDAPAADATQFDSEALWTQVAPQVGAGFSVLLVRGGSDALLTPHATSPWAGAGRDWLAQRCVERGAKVQAVVAYERRLPDWSDQAQRARLQEALQIPIWQLSNREALQALQAVPPERWANKTALVTHPRIAEAAQALGFGRVQLCAPGVPAFVAALESLSS